MVSGNSGVNQGGGIYNNGSLTLINSTVSVNSSIDAGGGICNCQRSTAATTLINSTVSNNSSNVGGGIFNDSNSLMTITNSTINGNSSNSGGGIFNNGDNATLNLTNVTMSGNSASGQGGAINTGSLVNLTNTTISGNSANQGGGILNTASVVNAQNTIIAGNSANSSPDFAGSLNSQGFNLIGNTTGTTISGTTTGNILNQNPQLAPLGNYGGPTQTHQLLSGSPAIDQGSATSGITTDQRGFMRPVDSPAIANASGGNGSDIGAFEAANVSLVVDNTTDNASLTACTTAANDCSLRGAITTANSTTADDTISFDATVFASARTITLTGGPDGELQIGGSGTLTINGTGANLLTVSGNNQSSIFFVLEGGNVTISNLTVSGGRGKNFGGSLGIIGGGIINSGSLSLIEFECDL